MTMETPRVGDAKGQLRFVVLTDTHINASDTETASPWAVNRLANARARAAVAAINEIGPDFAVHLGDVIHPLPGHTGYDAASERARSILSDLNCPLTVIPGNHDVGDKPLDWSPAEIVSDYFVDAFRKDHGADWTCFERDGCVFVGIDAQLINSGLTLEAEQWNWIEKTLQGATDKRIFFFLHYPPYICAPDEHEHYDNIGEPGRDRLLDLLTRHGVEACFSGHVHNFFYNLLGDMRSYTLPAVSAVRHDYAGLFPVPPADDFFGRDDSAKLGFLVVDVDAQGHRIRFLRSHGQSLGPGAESAPDHAAPHLTPYRMPFGSSRSNGTRLGATLRGSWAHVTEIAASGAVDEFRRKPARDDYFLTALWESGVNRVRMPIDDLTDAARRDRVRLLALDGFAVQVFSFGLPGPAEMAHLTAARDSIETLEIILPLTQMQEAVPAIEALGRDLGCKTAVSPLVQSGSDPGEGAFIHFIAHGFAPDATLPDWLAHSSIDAVGFRAGHRADPLIAAQHGAKAAKMVGKMAQIHVVTGDPNPARMDRDPSRTANRAVMATIAAHTVPDVSHLWLDTLSDVDRAYFPRLGLFDKRSNPGPAGVLVDRLAQALSGAADWSVQERIADPDGARIVLGSGKTQLTIRFSDRGELPTFARTSL